MTLCEQKKKNPEQSAFAYFYAIYINSSVLQVKYYDL